VFWDFTPRAKLIVQLFFEGGSDRAFLPMLTAGHTKFGDGASKHIPV
jgi:hypothetical protein